MDLTRIAQRLEPVITPAEFDGFRAVVEAVGPLHYVVKSNGSAIEFGSIYSDEFRIWFAPASAHSVLASVAKMMRADQRADFARFQYKFLRRDGRVPEKSRDLQQRRQDVIGDVE
jgi:hypothetical protein